MAHLGTDEIERARQFYSADPTSAAVLAFTRAVVDTKGQVGDGDVAAAHAAGLTDVQLADIVGHVALNVLTNYFNRAFDVDIDVPVVVPRPQKTAA